MKRQIFFFLLFIFSAIGNQSFSQWYNPEKVNKKAQMVYNAAINNLRNGNWQDGKSLLLESIKIEPKYVEAWLSLMSAYGEKKMYGDAIQAFDKAWKLDSVFSADMLLPYSINLAGAGRFAEANKAIDQYLTIVSPESRGGRAAAYRKKTYQFALDFAKEHGGENIDFNPVNLGDSINSNRSEYYPSFTIDDSLLVFTRRMEGFREDFFRSRLLPNGQYESATPIAGDLNEEASKGGIQMSPDGDWLFFAGNFPDQGKGDFDIYFCQSTPEGWSTPYNLGSAINTEFWESSPTISPDKQTLYFSSNRPGGYGGKDLYFSRRKSDGTWSLAENMGSVVNSASDDLAPFMHADNQTLYFTSGGHPGYGGSDLYFTRINTVNEWGTPQNLGYPINTIDDDGSLIVAANGTKAYFASVRSQGKGGLDLYSFDLPEHARAKQTQWVSGRVFDIKTGKGLPSAIELQNLSNKNWKERVVTDETGKYFVTLPVGEKYTFTVSRKGYLYYSDQFTLGEGSTDSIQKNIGLQPIEANSTSELKNIFFEINSFQLQESSFVELDKLVNLLHENPDLKVEIGGHTDNTGNATDNQKLSQNRAKSVVDYLISKGIKADRLTFKGYGSSQPIENNATEEGRKRNRRTELKVTGF